MLTALALLAFGALAFVAGLLAPFAWKQQLGTAFAPLERVLTAVAGPAPPAASGVSTALAGSAGSAALTASAPAASAASAVPREQLWAPAPAASGARFALLAGQFPAEASAKTLAVKLQQRGAMVNLLAVREVDASTSWLVALGQYTSSAAAYADAQNQATRLELNPPLAAIVLPGASASAAKP